MSLSYNTISKPTQCGPNSEQRDAKMNLQGYQCVSVLNLGTEQRLHSSSNLKVGSSCSDFPWLLPFFDRFWCLQLLITPPFRAKHTVQIMTSWNWTFPEAGVSLLLGVVWAERRNCLLDDKVPYCIFKCWAKSCIKLTHVLDDLSVPQSSDCTGNEDKQTLIILLIVLFAVQFWEAICRQPAARMWVHRPGTLGDDCGESHFSTYIITHGFKRVR